MENGEKRRGRCAVVLLRLHAESSRDVIHRGVQHAADSFQFPALRAHSAARRGAAPALLKFTERPRQQQVMGGACGSTVLSVSYSLI